MSDIATLPVGNPIVESIDQLSLPAAVDINVNQAIYINSGGQWALASAAAVGTMKQVYCAAKTVSSGQPLTGVRHGVLSGLDVDGMAIGDPIYLSDTPGAWATAAGTTVLLASRIIPAKATAATTNLAKLAKFDIPL